MDAETRRADDINHLYREALITGSFIANDLGTPEVAKALRRQATLAYPFGPLPLCLQ